MANHIHTEEVLLDDAWQVKLPAAAGQQLDVDGKPRARRRASVIFDPVADRGLMIGGWRDFGGIEAFHDTWSYEPATSAWSALDHGTEPAPS